MMDDRFLESDGGAAPAARGTRDDRAFIIGVLILGAALRVFHLGHQSLWVDELLTIIVATPKPDHSIWTLLLHNVHGPLHAFVVYLFRFVSESDFWVRLPSALAGTASIWFLFSWVRAWIGRREARIAAALLAVNPLHVYYSQEVRNYAFVVLFVVMGSWLLERLSRRWSARVAIGYGTAMAAAVLSNFSAAFVFMVHTVLWLVRRRPTLETLGRWVVVCAILFVLVSPWVYRVYTYIDVEKLVTPVMPGEIEESQRLRGDTTFRLEALPYAFYAFSAGFSLGPSLRDLRGEVSVASVLVDYTVEIIGVALLFGLLAVVGLSTARRRPRLTGELLLYLLVPIAATFALNWQNAKAFNVRYVLVALPAWLVLLALGLARLRPRARAVAAVAIVFATAVSLANLYFDGHYAREDVRGAVRYIEERPEAADCIFAPTVWHVVNHYYSGDEEVRYLFRRSWVPMQKVDEQLDELFAGCNAFWYIRAREWVDDPDDYALGVIRERCRELEVVRFDGVTLFLFQAQKGGGSDG